MLPVVSTESLKGYRCSASAQFERVQKEKSYIVRLETCLYASESLNTVLRILSYFGVLPYGTHVITVNAQVSRVNA